MISKRSNQRGSGLVENLVAVSLLTISLMGATSLFISSYQSNTASRTYTSLTSDVHTLIDSYRSQSFSSLLDKFGTSYTNITDGQTITETSSNTSSRANYTITFKAIKTSTTNIPEAVQILVRAVQRRGKFSDATYNFETIVAQTR